MHGSGRARLIDVARRAGVAKTTASDALSGSGRVSSATREAVLAAAAELGYTVNAAARHLRTGSVGTIGIVLPEVVSRSSYYMAFTFGIVTHAAAHDVDVTIVSPSVSSGRSRPLRADGLIIGDPLAGDPALPALFASGIPIVTQEHLPAGVDGDPVGVVWSSHETGMLRLFDEIDRTGSRHPALVVAPDSSDWGRQLVAGYRRACADRGLDPVIAPVSFESPWIEVRSRTEALLAERPETDVIVCGPDSSAIEVVATLERLGRVVGEDITVVSCVDHPSLPFLRPSITSIDLRPRESGVACASLLLDVLEGRRSRGADVEFPIAVVARQSTARELGRVRA
ncbi:LacI family DNA-binding transcriptional regulator [Microbacterium oleivorans]|uniref:LacI family DNA-binding transcriptional regulator n=1 Tax=Microbacterium oleivorans TaxID=273677 RepID=A0A7D5F4X8_9MICO|nr:LacI family DNA-binding transcriptional regulator [Microbacterium oleivorans]QLD11627.1 LacI family DNA-binding transcriptional regulator [Microbacterium oleivorans]